MAKPLSQLYNPLMQLLSQKDRFVSAKWILEGPTRVGCIQGVIGVSGDGQSQSSYRSERTGIFCIIQTIIKLCNYYGIRDGGITFGCDGKSAVEQAFGRNNISLADPSYDLLLAILSQSTLTWDAIHI